MAAPRTLSPEMDAWLQRQQATPHLEEVREPRNAPAPACPLSEAEFAWLWARFQKCRFGTCGAATRFARTELSHVTPRGKAFCLRMAFRHRTQLFGKAARKMGQDEFLSAVRVAAERAANQSALRNPQSAISA